MALEPSAQQLPLQRSEFSCHPNKQQEADPLKTPLESPVKSDIATTIPSGEDCDDNNSSGQGGDVRIPKEESTDNNNDPRGNPSEHGLCYAPKAEYYNFDVKGNNDNAVVLSAIPKRERPTFYLEPLDTLPPEAAILEHDVKLLHEAHHKDPFSVLGPRVVNTAEFGEVLVVRTWIKDAKRMKIMAMPNTAYVLTNDNAPVAMWERCDWLFQRCFSIKLASSSEDAPMSTCMSVGAMAKEEIFYYMLETTYVDNNTYSIRDTYSFGVVTSDYDLELFQSGSCWHVDNLMGAHCTMMDDCGGVRFVVWGPNAVFMSVVGDWNAWDARAHPMRHREKFGVWELFIPALHPGMKYGYRIHSKNGKNFIKIDPYAQLFENPPAHASIISDCDDAYKKPEHRFNWTDGEWMKARKSIADNGTIHRTPMSIYEVHLPSWMRGEHNSYLGYREMAERLVYHVKNLNFTHVEFLPLAHHPFEGSWGYQVSGLYAPYSRLGSADDLKYLINKLHENNIGVFIDWVPAHFVKDDWGLVYFDGEPCYEYADEREGEHKEWGTMVFNYRRNEVRSFLLGAAYHWLRRYHVDGMRIDAVSSMLYKNHMRKDGYWIPNEFGGDANLQAISLLQELNWVAHRQFPGVFMMAEESTSWKGVTDSAKGLGFDAKWDLGWMNDTLAYLCTPTSQRTAKHSKLTFRGLYLHHEKWVLPLSHDEVVNGKGSLLDKCGFKGAPYEERIKTLRTLFGFQVGSPGRPLIFMGSEFGQGREWQESRSIDWHESREPLRSRLLTWVADLMAVYKHHKALHAGDDEIWNFQWVDCDNAQDNIIAWIRRYMEWYNDILCVCNFSGQNYHRYPVGVPHGGQWQVLLNSDDWRYGGDMHGPGNLTHHGTTQGGRLGWPYCLWLDIPAFGCLYLRPIPPTTDSPSAKTEGNAGTSDENVVKDAN